MPAIDFTTALARLLQNGSLRDELAKDAQSVLARMELCESDRTALLALDAEELEIQAQVLLRKRLDLVGRVLPRTCQHLRNEAWPLFAKYGRSCWPKANPVVAADAYAFCASLQSTHPDAINPMEWNRLRFAISKKSLAAHLVTRNAAQPNTAVQILFRIRPCRWREVLFYAKL